MRNPCFMVKRDLVLVYIYPVFGGKYDDYAKRFAVSFRSTKPAIPYKLVVVSNGSPPRPDMQQTFAEFSPVWFTHNNQGWDIGAFQRVSESIPAHTMVFFSNSAYFLKPGWLERMIEVSDKHGPALFGSMGNMGDKGARVWPHIRTTGFWTSPTIFNQYPLKVTSPHQRYEFEHGRNCLSEWATNVGLTKWVATFDQVYPYPHWDACPNCYHRGNQSGLLSGDRLTEPPFYPPGS